MRPWCLCMLCVWERHAVLRCSGARVAPLLAEAVIDWKGETGRAFDFMCTCHTVCLLSRGLRVCQQLCVCMCVLVWIIQRLPLCVVRLVWWVLEGSTLWEEDTTSRRGAGDGGAVQARGVGVQCSQCMQCLCFACSTAVPPTCVDACQLPSLAVFTRRRIQ